MAVDSAEPDRVWALTSAGLARSDDAGLNWQPVSALEELAGQPQALAIGSDVLWLTTEDPRALCSVSIDDDATWLGVGDHRISRFAIIESRVRGSGFFAGR